MARFDVYAHPDPGIRTRTPYLLDVQNEYIDGLDTRVVIPMRAAHLCQARLRDLNPLFDVAGEVVVLDAAAIAAFPVRELGRRVANLGDQRDEIVGALDCLFGAY